jgi:hypothetical protein
MAGEGRAEIDAAISRYLERLAVAIETDAKAGCPVDTGALATSIESEVNGQTIRVGSNLGYAASVEMGAAPHIIRVKNARVLANRETGQVFGPVVHHPGNKAQPFLRPSLFRQRGAL